MVEIIKRVEGQKSEKIQLCGTHSQISLNSDGRIAIRIIESDRRDNLIVLDTCASAKLISFIQDRLANVREREIRFDKLRRQDEIPF